METDTYSNASVVEMSNRSFVNVSVYLDAPSPIAQKFAVESVPATILATPEGVPVRRWEGYLGPEEYKSALEKAVSTHLRLKGLLPQLKADPDGFELNRAAGDCYAFLAQNRPAADAYKKAAAKAPDPKARGELLARALGELVDVEISDALNEELIAVSAELEQVDREGKFGLKGDALAARAQVALNRERRDEAIRLYEEIVDQHPRSSRAPAALLGLADLYHHHQKNNARAVQALRRLLDQYPSSAVAGDARELLEQLEKR